MKQFIEPRGCPVSPDGKHDMSGTEPIFESKWDSRHYHRLIDKNEVGRAREFALTESVGMTGVCIHCGATSVHESLMNDEMEGRSA